MNHQERKTRKHLSADSLFRIIRERFETIADPRPGTPVISLADALMSALAMFVLKAPSLLAFDQDARPDSPNLQTIFGVQRVPSDTRMREILDPVDPEQLAPAFHDVFRQFQRGKGLEAYEFYQGCYLLSLDGTGYFSSERIHCDDCLEKVNSRTGQVTYHHQMLGAVLLHPHLREVIPLPPEPICKQDGQAKNDCERNASLRHLAAIRRAHPKLQLIVVEDGLASNGPHVQGLRELRMHFLLIAKEGDHQHLEQQVMAAWDEGRVEEVQWSSVSEPDFRHLAAFVNNVPLNASHPDELVNYLEYWQVDEDEEVVGHWAWITDLPIHKGNAPLFTQGGRARWRIENETFNTLKNQGYHFEHNYGHGYIHLSTVFAYLMMLAFLVDQIQQRCCPLFQAAWDRLKSKRSLWEKQRSHFHHFVFTSMRHLYLTIITDAAKSLPAPMIFDTS